MKQLITRVNDELAAAVKRRAESNGESVNTFVTRLLSESLGERHRWKQDALAAGRLVHRDAPTVGRPHPTVSTAPGYASDLISADRDER